MSTRKILFIVIVSTCGGVLLPAGIYIAFRIANQRMVSSFNTVNQSLIKSRAIFDSLNNTMDALDDSMMMLTSPGAHSTYMAFKSHYTVLDSSLLAAKETLLQGEKTGEASYIDRLMLKEGRAAELKSQVKSITAIYKVLADSLHMAVENKHDLVTDEPGISWEELNFSNVPLAAAITNLNVIHAWVSELKNNIQTGILKKRYGT